MFCSKKAFLYLLVVVTILFIGGCDSSQTQEGYYQEPINEPTTSKQDMEQIPSAIDSSTEEVENEPLIRSNIGTSSDSESNQIQQSQLSEQWEHEQRYKIEECQRELNQAEQSLQEDPASGLARLRVSTQKDLCKHFASQQNPFLR